MKITFVIPTFNEAENLPNMVTALFALPVAGLNILVVDDNSTDGTGQMAEEMAKKWDGKLFVIHRPGKMGLGTAYIQGFRYALAHEADAIGQIDADFSHPPAKVLELITALETCDIAVGSRYVPGGSLDEKWPAWRKGLSAFGNLYARTILGLHLHDATGGFRLWRSPALAKVPLDRIRSNGYVFQVETIYLAEKLGFSVTEVPIHFADRRWGKSKMNLRIQMEAAFRVWQLLGMYRDLRKKPTLQV